MNRTAAWGCVALLASLSAISLAADELRGPRFGPAQIRSAIIDIAGEADADDLVTPLVAGEALAVTVTAGKKSALVPQLILIDPDGLARSPVLNTGKGGRQVKFKRFAVDKTGNWAVRIRGGQTVGAWSAKFRIKKPAKVGEKKLALGDGAGLEAMHTFDAVGGALLDLQVKWSKKGAPVAVRRLLDPDGNEVPGVRAALESARTKARLRKFELPGGPGTYTLVVGIDAGTASYAWAAKLDTRGGRPTGKIALDPKEPYLRSLTTPLEGSEGMRVTLSGAQFSIDPWPQVYFDGEPVTVASVSASGLRIEVLPPQHPVGTEVDVAVVNPDGQAACRAAYFRYVEPPPPPPPPPPPMAEVALLEPDQATLEVGETKEFMVRLTRAAGDGGASVQFATTGGIGTAPVGVTVPEGLFTATFSFTAGQLANTGSLVATLGRTTSAEITVTDTTPPTPAQIDISGWTLRQANATWSYTFPANTVLTEGGYAVVGRNATKSAFESHWSVTLAQDVLYFDSVDAFPKINGDETYSLEDAQGNTVDGATIAMGASAGRNLQRSVPVGSAGNSGSWVDTTVSTTNATPGSGQATPSSPTGVYISEFSDASGSGNFVYEFVELHFDGLPD